MKERLNKLNPSVKINVISDSIDNKDTSFYSDFDVVCVTGKSLDSLVRLYIIIYLYLLYYFNFRNLYIYILYKNIS